MRYCLLLAALCAGPASAQLDVASNAAGGVEKVTAGDITLAQDVHVRLVKPGWQGAFGTQTDPAGLSVEKTEVDGQEHFSGQFACEGRPCRFEQTITRRPDGFSIAYRITPTETLEAELIAVMVDLPASGSAGTGSFAIHDGGVTLKTPLPAELPDPYHLAGSGSMQWCGWVLAGGAGLRVTPDGAGIRGVRFQDNRQFGIEAFQAQFAVEDSRILQAGRTYEFGLDFALMSEDDIRAVQEAVMDPSEAARVELASDRPLSLGAITPSAETVALYEKLELDLDLHATYDNPFDPDEIDVTARFVGPEGREMLVPGFLYQDFDWVGETEKRWLATRGGPAWKVRFAPNTTGPWSAIVTARDRSGTVTSEPVRFICAAGPADGYVRRAEKTPYYLRFDSGRPYFAVGGNMCWSGGAMDDYSRWMSRLGAAGGNYCRLWLVRWNMGLEWTNQGRRSGWFYGLGRYSLDNAYRLDWVMEQARANRIYCMLCLGYHGELQDKEDYFKSNCWHESPYNAANGGPCAEPAEFWTNETARRLYRQKLRYYIARWGWDSHVLSWQFWNEVTAPAPWVEEMADYLAQHDPYDHLVTTTYGYDEVWRLPGIDYTLAHTYGSDESRTSTTEHIAALAQTHTASWPKPFMVGEFGIDWKASDGKHDPSGLGTSMHNGMWVSVMTRSFGTAALWYWDGYVDPLNMYREFTPIRRFVDQIPWPELDMQPATFTLPTVPVAPDAPAQDAVVTGGLFWARHTGTDFTVNHDGSISGEGDFSQTLFADSKKDLKAPLRFHVDYGEDGVMVVRVGKVSARGKLEVLLDGRPHWTRELPCGPGDGEWKEAKFEEQWGIWQCVYDRDYEVPIPAGKHTIQIDNNGDDWVLVTQYVFRDYKDPRFVRAHAYGLRTDDLAVLWLHDRTSTWYNDRYGEPPRPIADASLELKGLAAGEYRVHWWDTRTGEVVRTDRATCADGLLPLQPPTFTRDIAAQVTRED